MIPGLTKAQTGLQTQRYIILMIILHCNINLEKHKVVFGYLTFNFIIDFDNVSIILKGKGSNLALNYWPKYTSHKNEFGVSKLALFKYNLGHM